MPFVAGSGTPLPQTGSVQVSELSAPAPDGLIADHHPAACHHLFRISKTHCKSVIEANGVRDDFPRKAMTAIRVPRHPFSIASGGHLLLDSALSTYESDRRCENQSQVC